MGLLSFQKVAKWQFRRILVAGMAVGLALTAWPVLAAAPAGTLTGTNQSIKVSATTDANAITITDSGAEIKAANSIKIKLATNGTMNAIWDTSVTTATASGTAVSAGKISATPAVTYADSNKTAVIAVAADFVAGQAVTISGLKLTGESYETSASALTWSVDGATFGSGTMTVEVTPGAMTSINIRPQSSAVNGSSVVDVSFTTVTAIPADGVLVITFPSRYTLTGVTSSSFTCGSGLDGTFLTSVSSQTATITRQNDGTTSAAGAKVCSLSGVINPSINSSGTFAIETQTSAGATQTIDNSNTNPPAAVNIRESDVATTRLKVTVVSIPSVVTSHIVTINSFVENATEMLVSSEPQFLNSVWQPYSGNYSWDIKAGDGPKKIYIMFRNASGTSDIYTLSTVLSSPVVPPSSPATPPETPVVTPPITPPAIPPTAAPNDNNIPAPSANPYQTVTYYGHLAPYVIGKNLSAERAAITIFIKIYKRLPVGDNWHAVHYLAYGGLVKDRNMNAERAAITAFKKMFGHVPSGSEWRTLHVMAYWR